MNTIREVILTTDIALAEAEEVAARASSTAAAEMVDWMVDSTLANP
jgi:hypothetical protein